MTLTPCIAGRTGPISEIRGRTPAQAAKKASGFWMIAPSAGGAFSDTVNTLPTPRSLSTVISPPSRCARSRLMLSPSPVPPNRRVVDASACLKGANSDPIASGSIPMPVSSITKRSVCASLSYPTPRVTVPDSVNFTALPTRFTMICLIRAGSEMTSEGIGDSHRTSSAMPLATARWPSNSIASLAISPGDAGTCSMLIRPAPILEQSSRSFTSASSCAPFRAIVDAKSATAWGLRSAFSESSSA